MNWNMPWFSHRNYPPSTRLNISGNEWHRLLYPLIIKIRIMTLFWTRARADSQGHSLSDEDSLARKRRQNELNDSNTCPSIFLLLASHKLWWQNDQMIEFLEPCININTQYSHTGHVPWALYCLVTVRPLSRNEMKTWISSSVVPLHTCKFDLCHQGGLWNHVAAHQSVTELSVHTNARAMHAASCAMEGEGERERDEAGESKKTTRENLSSKKNKYIGKTELCWHLVNILSRRK